MITGKDTTKTLAGYTWEEVKQGVDKILRSYLENQFTHLLTDPTYDFCAHIIGLMQGMEIHAYTMTAEQGFMWLYVKAHQYDANRNGTAKVYKDILALLVDGNYLPVPGAESRTRLYELFNAKCLVTPTHGAVLWTAYLQTGTEKRAKPNFEVYAVFPWLVRIMPPFYRQDISLVEDSVRETIFMLLPNLLGNFAQKHLTDAE